MHKKSCVDCVHYRVCKVRAAIDQFKTVAAPMVKKERMDFIVDMEDRMGTACAEFKTCEK